MKLLNYRIVESVKGTAAANMINSTPGVVFVPNKTPCAYCGMDPLMAQECANSGNCDNQKMEYPREWEFERQQQSRAPVKHLAPVCDGCNKRKTVRAQRYPNEWWCTRCKIGWYEIT